LTQRGDDTDREPDIVLEVLQRVRVTLPALTEALAQEIEAHIKAEYGGRRVRIPKRKKHATAEQREAILKDALNPSASDEEITQRHGIHRATMYRMLKRG
jgi:transposase